MLKELIPTDWRAALEAEFNKDYFIRLERFIEAEYLEQTIFPPQNEIFNALKICPLESVRVVIIGQDPYHDLHQAHGLCFSVREGVKLPPSLRNIYKEIAEQMLCETPKSGDLTRWAEQGVLLLNAVLTVRAHEAASHAKQGWEQFTDAIIDAVGRQKEGVVYMLWGNYAKKKGVNIDSKNNHILHAAHPSPLSFRHRAKDLPQFLEANKLLEKPIEW